MSRLHDAIEKARKEGTVAKPRPAEAAPPVTNTGGISFVEGPDRSRRKSRDASSI